MAHTHTHTHTHLRTVLHPARQVNFFGTVALTEKLRHFLAPEGRIVNVASHSGTSAISRLKHAATKQCLIQAESLVTKHKLGKFSCACTRQFIPHTT